MKTFIGTKIILAVAMSRLAYNNYRGWDLPSDEDGSDEGFLVEYVDGGQSNHPDHKGYISWSPKDVFEKSYRSASGMNFGLAVEAMKMGHKVARLGWNGNDMFVYYVPANSYPAERGANVHGIFKDNMVPYRHYLAIKTAQGDVSTWVPSISDCLEDDWEVVE